MRLLDQAVALLVEELEDPQEAVRLVRYASSRFASPELQRKVKIETLLPLLVRVGRIEELHHAEAELASKEPLAFWDHHSLAEAAGDTEHWPLALAQAESALLLAELDAVQAGTLRDRRNAQKEVYLALLEKARALCHLDRMEEGLADLARAGELGAELDQSSLGIYLQRLKLYHGTAMAAAGQLEEAIRMLAEPALVYDDRAALHALQAAYQRLTGSRDGFAQRCRELHLQLCQPFGDFTLLDYARTAYRFSDLARDKVAVVVFWFPGCTLCLVELPRLQPIWEAYRDQGVVVMALEVTDNPEQAQRFIRDRELDYLFLRDRSLVAEEQGIAVKRFGLRSFPVLLVVDADGLIRYLHVDYSPGAEGRIEEQVKTLLVSEARLRPSRHVEPRK